MADKNFKIKTGLDLPAPLPAAQGGTGQTSLSNALNALLPDQTNNASKILGTNGSTVTWTNPGASYSDGAPANPAVGQIWVESDSSSDSFDPNIIRRKSFTATAAQTVFTTDLEFIQGYEQVFFNGMLLLRNSDYTTASNTNVTLTSGAAAGDIIEIVSITNLNSINAATTTSNTFVGNQTIQGSVSITGVAESVHVDGAGNGYRIRSNTSNNNAALQFTNNSASSDWSYIGAINADKMVIRKSTGANTGAYDAWLNINGGPVHIRDVRADNEEASDWPVPTLSVQSHDTYFENTMFGMFLRDDNPYTLDFSKWVMRLSHGVGDTTSSSSTNLKFGGPGALILSPGNAERMRIDNAGVVNVVSGNLQVGGLPVGMVLVSSTTVSNSSGATFDNVFTTSGYDHYLIEISGGSFSVADADLTMALRLSGTGTVAFDNGQYQQQYATTVTSNVSSGGRLGFGSSSYSGLFGAQVTLLNPLPAAPTVGFVHGHSINSSGQPYRFTSSIYKWNTTSYFGFALTPSSGTFSAVVRVYGLRNS